jgi:hypothetical protein
MLSVSDKRDKDDDDIPAMQINTELAVLTTQQQTDGLGKEVGLTKSREAGRRSGNAASRVDW